MPSLAQRAYKAQQQALMANLEILFRRYRARLEGEHAAALINLRRTGYTLLNEVDFFLFPDCFAGSESDDIRDNHYESMADVYDCANTLINHLCQDQLNQDNIQFAKNALQNTIAATIVVHSGCERLCYGLDAFGSALLLVAGFALITLVATTPVGIGVGIGVSVVGLFSVVCGGTRAIYSAGHACNTLEKDNNQFSTAAQNFCQVVRG